MKSFISNQLNKSLYYAILEAENCQENIIGLDLFLLGLLREKNSLAFKIFQKTYKDPENVLKNLKEFIYDLHKTKNYQSRAIKSSELSLTPTLENLLFKLSILQTKNKSVLTTKDIFFFLVSYKKLNFYLKKADQKT